MFVKFGSDTRPCYISPLHIKSIELARRYAHGKFYTNPDETTITFTDNTTLTVSMNIKDVVKLLEREVEKLTIKHVENLTIN